jgi:hypothetical protein
VIWFWKVPESVGVCQHETEPKGLWDRPDSGGWTPCALRRDESCKLLVTFCLYRLLLFWIFSVFLTHLDALVFDASN